MEVTQPRMQRHIALWIRLLSTLDEIGGIEHRAQMLIGTALVQVTAASDGVAVIAFFVLMQQDDVSGARAGSHLAQAPQHFVAVAAGGRRSVTCGRRRRGVERKYPNILSLECPRDCDGTF